MMHAAAMHASYSNFMHHHAHIPHIDVQVRSGPIKMSLTIMKWSQLLKGDQRVARS